MSFNRVIEKGIFGKYKNRNHSGIPKVSKPCNSCGDEGHLYYDCPLIKNRSGGSRSQEFVIYLI